MKRPEKLMTISEVCDMVQLKPWAIYHNIRTNDFPRPIKLNSRVSRWDRAEIVLWINRQGASE